MSTREKLLDAAIQIFMSKGYSGSSVDEICQGAGATKGAFFHHFKSKEQVGLLALERYDNAITDMLTSAAAQRPDEPVGRVEDVFDAILGMVSRPEPACLVAMMTLELAVTHPAVRESTGRSFEKRIDFMAELFSDALKSRGQPTEGAHGLSEYFWSTMQGALILARARGNNDALMMCCKQFRAHFDRVLNVS